MKYLLFFVSLLLSGTQAVDECNTSSEFNVELPDGFTVTHTFKENGLFGAVDEFGNGINVYIKNGEFESDVQPDGSMFIVDNPGPIDPYNAIFVVPKGGSTVQAYLYEFGDPQTHGAFEDQVVKLARSFAQGGRDGKAWKDCVWNVLDFNGDRTLSEG
ncbi:hypothetical protein C0416_01990 [bacterium]|nr:hypothetical protein [bacterium]